MIEFEDSVLLVDKPLYWSTFDVLRYLKKEYRTTHFPDSTPRKKLKIGHAGTLDPLATGLVIVCTGKKTKSISMFQDLTKEYFAHITFGGVTKSYDSEFLPTNYTPTSHLTLDIVKQKINGFVGTIRQQPPLFSALKIDGKRAYSIARTLASEQESLSDNTQSMTLQKRHVYVYSFEIDKDQTSLIPTTLEGKKYHTIKCTIRCSKGTYIRSLAHDLGEVLGCGGFLTSLRRTKIGEYDVESAIQPTNQEFTSSLH